MKLYIKFVNGNILWLRGQIYPSMRKDIYGVYVCVEVDDNSTIVKIIKVVCECKDKNSFKCHHCCAILMAVCSFHYELAQPLPCTSRDQAWGRAGFREDVDGLVLQDICHMPFVKSTYKTSASKRRNVLDNGQSKKHQRLSFGKAK